jgi:hypothetical protein
MTLEEAKARNWLWYEEDRLQMPLFHRFRRDPRYLLIFEANARTDRWRTNDEWPDFCADQTLPYSCKAEVDKLISSRPPAL